MKILMVNEYFAFVGGTEQYLLPLCTELEKMGHCVSVVYGIRTGEESDVSRGKTYCVENTLSLHSRNNITGLTQLRRIIASENPDLIYIHQVHNPLAIEVLTDAKPCIRYVHGYKIACPAGHRTLSISDSICEDPVGYRCLVRAYTERCMPRNLFVSHRLIRTGFKNLRASLKIEKFLVASSYMRQMLVNNGIHGSSIEVIPYYTSLPQLSENDTHREHIPSILFIGRLVREKGLDYLVQALKRVQGQWQCTIVGQGPELEPVKSLVKKLGIFERFSFPGWVPNESIGGYYQKARMVVVPSVWPEPFGIVGIEAMARARPVLAFDVGGISQWLENNKTGYLVKRKDIFGLAENISLLLREKDLAVRFGRQGRKNVEGCFTREIHMLKLLKVIQNVLSE